MSIVNVRDCKVFELFSVSGERQNESGRQAAFLRRVHVEVEDGADAAVLRQSQFSRPAYTADISGKCQKGEYE